MADAETRSRSHVICPAEDIAAGERRIVDVEGRSVGIFNVDGTLYAYLNRCPHRYAPVCQGTVSGTYTPSEPGKLELGMDGQVLRCPWHGWEFDLRSGRSLFNDQRGRLGRCTVSIEDGQIVVALPGARRG